MVHDATGQKGENVAHCALYSKDFSDTEPCPHCAWERDVQNADPSEFHWASKWIVEFRGKWFWTDETENFGNYEPCNTQSDAEAQQEEYCKHL